MYRCWGGGGGGGGGERGGGGITILQYIHEQCIYKA